MARPGVKPARLTLRSAPVVTSVIEVPPRKPLTIASALDLPPAHPAYCDDRREKSPGGLSAQAGAAATRAAQSAARSRRCVFMAISSWFNNYGERAHPGSVSPLREPGGPIARHPVGAFLP